MAADAQMMSHFYSPLHHMYSPLHPARYPAEQKYMPDQKYPDQKYPSADQKYPSVEQKYAMDGGVKYGGYEGHVYQSPPIDQDKHKVVTPPPPQPPHQFDENRSQYLAPPEPLDVKPQMPMAEKRDGGKELENGDGKGETNYPGTTAESEGYSGYFVQNDLQHTDLGHPAYGGYSTTGGFGLDSAISRQRNNKNKSQAG